MSYNLTGKNIRTDQGARRPYRAERGRAMRRIAPAEPPGPSTTCLHESAPPPDGRKSPLHAIPPRTASSATQNRETASPRMPSAPPPAADGSPPSPPSLLGENEIHLRFRLAMLGVRWRVDGWLRLRLRWQHRPSEARTLPVRAHQQVEGRDEVVEVLLAYSAEVSPAQAQKYSLKPFLQAVVKGSESMVSLFLLAGANPNEQDQRARYGDSTISPALTYAIPLERILRRLLAAAADPTAVNDSNDSVISHALVSGQTTVIQILIDEGLDFSRHLGRFHLSHAAVRGGRAVLDLLVNTGKWDFLLSPVHVDPITCEKALKVAAETAQVETLQWLLDRGFLPVRHPLLLARTVNLRSPAALTDAADEKAAATLDLLLRAGLDLDAQISYGTPLMNVGSHYYAWGEPQRFRMRARMLLDRGATLLPPKSLPQATRYRYPARNAVGHHPELNVMTFQELEARCEPWSVVEHLFRSAEYKASLRHDWGHIRVVRQYSWRVRYPV
ncbi:hypothetical protein ASPACDRAFT_41063 [Aspergillus aculeatus ATCC 16872]|uniref:Uncharacterized protein n=1 Tax=Aspergillus aculeatus (strain ATCC 16872 / CBS 172.66 / WB 5094) TaxID=690307 RepID=A0A1L9X1K9_ASPA1|nr:uncharacterized protein ASPACDRAFT_41063 [Aspergillus aculeatus ATCC 16872]OJK02244.1 hypothetical protein ASPACDRAFT_41063 [Aspergillus aculeatus ATCC 16872]